MKKYYQLKGGKKGRFALRENTYRRTWYLIADYPYFKALERGLADAGAFTGGSSGNIKESSNNLHHEESGGSQVAEMPCGYETDMPYIKYIKAIEDAMKQIPEPYGEQVLSHIVERKKYKDIEGVSERTLKLWTQRFIWNVAHNMGDA